MSATSDTQRVELERLAAGIGPDDLFSVERVHTAGTPVQVAERLLYRAGKGCERVNLNGASEEGGAPLGHWRGPADAQVGMELARTLCEASVWEVESQPIRPGGSLLVWRVVTSAGALTLFGAGSGPLPRKLSRVDVVLRRMASGLVQTGRGAAVHCELDLQAVGDTLVARAALVHAGNEPLLVPGPFAESDVALGNGARIEFATPIDSTPGVTGAAPAFQPVDFEAPEEPPPRWQESLILLRPRERLEFPWPVSFAPPGPSGTMIRARFVCYGREIRWADLPALSGDLYSTVEVVS